MASSNSEWEQRRLCSDGSCIGIIGANGRCKECGLPDDPKEPSAVAGSDGADDGVKDVNDASPVADEAAYQGDEPVIAVESADDSWEERTLCVDESCIGVVGDDGRCKACGKPYPG